MCFETVSLESLYKVLYVAGDKDLSTKALANDVRESMLKLLLESVLGLDVESPVETL